MICVWLLRAPTFAELKPTRQALRTSPLGGLSARSAFRRSLRSRRNRRARASQRTRGARFGRQVARRLRCFAPAALATLGDSGICSGLCPQQAFLSATALRSPLIKEAHAAGASHFAFGRLVCSKRFPTLPAVASEPPRPCFATDAGGAFRQASRPPSPLLRARRSRYARGQRYLLGATPPAGIFVG